MKRLWLLIIIFSFSAGVAFYFLRPKEPAPPYAEIKQSVEQIMAKWDLSSDTGGGVDFVWDPEVLQELTTYRDFVNGKEAQGWRGWLVSFSPTAVTGPGSNYYHLTVSMVEPSTRTGARFGDMVRIREVHRDVLSDLKPCEKVSLGHSRCREYAYLDHPDSWRSVIFTGTIIGIRSDSEVEIGDVTIVSED